MKQNIIPNQCIFFAGDIVKIEIFDAPKSSLGKAFLRTNLGNKSIYRRQIIDQVDNAIPKQATDWHDIELTYNSNNNSWFIEYPLLEVGSFSGKCYFRYKKDDSFIWVDNDDFYIKVEPANSITNNTIYSAFVRQFGPWQSFSTSPDITDAENYLNTQNYTVLPPSGTFRSLKQNLSHIFEKLNCKILQLLPIHPVPVQYARMGRIGSPFAALDYYAVDSSLAEFDKKSTPMEQFLELVDAVHSYNGKIFMDIPVNHTGWASKLQQEHPEYFMKNSDNSFKSPGAWGITWEDLCSLDYSKKEVICEMANVFLYWCKRQVDGFRCDAGYMVPKEAWDYIVSIVREQYPQTIFFLEGLGGKLEVQETLLKDANLNWAYSELFQNYSREEICRYYPVMSKTANNSGNMISFAETHDNARLASNGKTFAKLRFAITALLSSSGGFGFTNGAEFFATEKIDVHGIGGLNWNKEDNLVDYIAKLNTIITNHPSFGANSKVEFIQTNDNNVLAVKRTSTNCENIVLLLFNLDCHNSTTCSFHSISKSQGVDILNNSEAVYINDSNKEISFVNLAPGQARCIVFNNYCLDVKNNLANENLLQQNLSFMARLAAYNLKGLDAAVACDVSLFHKDVKQFFKQLTNHKIAPIVTWDASISDYNRTVMVPPRNVLYIKSLTPFIVEIKDKDLTKASLIGLPSCDKSFYFAIYVDKCCKNKEIIEKTLTISYTTFPEKGKAVHYNSNLLFLGNQIKNVPLTTTNFDETIVFANNSTSSYSFFPANWGKINSKYNAILAGNSIDTYPDNRYVMFNRCRCWVVYNNYSKVLDKSNCKEFITSLDNYAKWIFEVAFCQDVKATIEVSSKLYRTGNRVKLTFKVLNSSKIKGPIKVILRPDLEDRVNHQVTKAFTLPEQRFVDSVETDDQGFIFGPNERKLFVTISNGNFVKEPEWQYMQYLPQEDNYGLDCYTDLFSPGYFEAKLKNKEATSLCAIYSFDGSFSDRPRVIFEEEEEEPNLPKEVTFNDCLEEGLFSYMARREEFGTIIAGYPWFSDWGRDTLITLRGFIKDKQLRPQVYYIIKTFAKYQYKGTLPNMICGNNDSNRDTSDAPLYLIVAIKELCEEYNNHYILTEQITEDKNLREVLEDIVGYYILGTPNGIVADRETLLVYSPSHFTWMDTNHPAGSPREGYPIEIQCLWYSALEFLGYHYEAEKVSQSIEKYFFSEDRPFASDCLHCGPNTKPKDAIPDDHLRCNQLFCITMNAVKNPILREKILTSSQELLIPGAIRTLANRKVDYPLPIILNGQLLNNPNYPYQGYYAGPEDTSRKIAYHNGTAWVWPFPSYCEALFLEGGKAKLEECISLLHSVTPYLISGVIGHLPEVIDGNFPHKAGGCAAQAWSLSEVYRVNKLLSRSL